MENLTDRDMAYDVLYGTKQAATLFMEATLESASPACRHLFHRLHDDAMRDQWRVWQFLHAKGEYRVEEAGRAEVDACRRRMEHLWQTHRQPAGRQAFDGERSWDERRGWDGAPSGGDWYGAPAGPRYATGYAGAYGPAAGAGAYGAAADSGVAFEPGGGLPQETRFESERGFAGTRGAPPAYGTARAPGRPGEAAAGPALSPQGRPAPYAEGAAAHGATRGEARPGPWNAPADGGRRGQAPGR